MEGRETISYGLNYWSPTVIAISLFLAHPPIEVKLPMVIENPESKQIGYFNPANCSYYKAIFSDEEKTHIIFSFAQKIMTDSQEVDPSVYQVLLENRKNFLL